MQAQIHLWAHVVLLVAALALCGFVAERGFRREDRIRKKLGACRSALDACEILRDQYRRERDGLSIECARYRKLMPPEFRLTQVMTDKPEE